MPSYDAIVSEDSSCIFDGVSRSGSDSLLHVKSPVKCDVLEAVDVFVSSDENDERIFLDYSRKAGMFLGVWGTGGMKSAKAVRVERSKLLRARIVLDYDVRHNSYIASRSKPDGDLKMKNGGTQASTQRCGLF